MKLKLKSAITWAACALLSLPGASIAILSILSIFGDIVGVLYILWDSLKHLLRGHIGGWLAAYFLVVIPLGLLAGEIADRLVRSRFKGIDPDSARMATLFTVCALGAGALCVWIRTS
jgi:MFS family permease